jgi:hypothetical protein
MSDLSPTTRHAIWRVLIPLSIVLTIYVYLYPIFHGCAFPSPALDGKAAFFQTLKHHVPIGQAPPQDDPLQMRLLVFGDPQLEGDTSLPRAKRRGPLPAQNLRSLIHTSETTFEAIRHVLRAWNEPFSAIWRQVRRVRKIIDLLGNDFYLSRIHAALKWWTRPTHITVVGDLLGSQWINDVEFGQRADRFWSRVFQGEEKVPDELTTPEPGRTEKFLADPAWSRRLINVVGNHDIGYAGEINIDRIERFEQAFGGVNWEIKFELPETVIEGDGGATIVTPTIRLVVLNSMNLDTPAFNQSLQTQTYDFMNSFIRKSHSVDDTTAATILLTHLPLYKPKGVCVDAPLFTFYPPEKDFGLREQNHLSDVASGTVLKSIYGFGGSDKSSFRQGVIINGHDHAGCDVWHSLWDPQAHPDTADEDIFNQTRLRPDNLDSVPSPGIREITQRSMMGEFGGYAGLFTATWQPLEKKWVFQYSRCAAGVQHIWWLAVILDLSVLGALATVFLFDRPLSSASSHKQGSAGAKKHVK